MIIAKQLILALGIATLAACGGGGGGTSTQNNASNSSSTPSSSSSSQHETTSTAPAAGESDTPSGTGTTTTDATTTTDTTTSSTTPPDTTTTGTDTTTSTSTGTDPVVDNGTSDTTTDTVTDTTPVPSVPDIALSWAIPAAREDGSYMPVYEIAGYELRYTKDQSTQVTVVRINDAQTTDWVLEDVTPGNYQFTIATIDSDGLYSANSQTVSTRIQ